jgi:transcriptional regulator with XRE-family HTH domain
MSNQKQARRIRSRKIGVLLRDARLKGQKSVEDCANALAVKPDHYLNLETGTKAPTLPELEVLSYYFDLPIEHFWGNATLGENHSNNRTLQADVLIPLRQRMIGVLLKQARERKNFSLEEVSKLTDISEEQLLSYEMGEIPVQITDMQSIAAAMGTDVQDFIDVAGPYGAWRQKELLFNRFMELPPELRDFVMKPVNRPYMDIARRLSQLSTGELRQIAEGLLEITF